RGSFLQERRDLRRARTRLPTRGRFSAIPNTLEGEIQRAARRLARLCCARLAPVLPFIPPVSDNHDFARYIYELASVQRAYKPQVYPGRVILFLAGERASSPDAEHTRLGWEGLAAGGLETHQIPGDHTSIFQEPHVRALAVTLRTRLEQAQ